MPDGRLFLRKTICDMTICQDCARYDFFACKDPTRYAGYWIEMNVTELEGTTRETTSGRAKKGEGDPGPPFMVNALPLYDS